MLALYHGDYSNTAFVACIASLSRRCSTSSVLVMVIALLMIPYVAHSYPQVTPSFQKQASISLDGKGLRASSSEIDSLKSDRGAIETSLSIGSASALKQPADAKRVADQSGMSMSSSSELRSSEEDHQVAEVHSGSASAEAQSAERSAAEEAASGKAAEEAAADASNSDSAAHMSAEAAKVEEEGHISPDAAQALEAEEAPSNTADLTFHSSSTMVGKSPADLSPAARLLAQIAALQSGTSAQGQGLVSDATSSLSAPTGLLSLLNLLNLANLASVNVGRASQAEVGELSGSGRAAIALGESAGRGAENAALSNLDLNLPRLGLNLLR